MTDFTTLPIPAKKISELASYTAQINSDLLTIVDVTANATKKITHAALKKYFSPLNIYPIYSEADLLALGTVSGDSVILPSGHYRFCATFATTKDIVPASGASIQLSHSQLGLALLNTRVGGTGLKVTDPFGIIIVDSLILQVPNGKIFDFAEVAGQALFINSIFANAVDAGTIKCATATFNFTQFTNCGTGIVFENNATQVSIDKSSASGFRNVGTTMYTFKGNIPTIALNFTRITATSNDVIYDFDRSLKSFGTNISATLITIANKGAGVYAPNSLTPQNYNRFVAFGCNGGIVDGLVIGAAEVSTNSLVSVITTVNVPALINAVWSPGSITAERTVKQDLITFDAATDFATSRNIISNAAAPHGLTNGNIISFWTYTGTLPAELIAGTDYYVVNSTASTFQVSATLNGSPINITSAGTGTNYYRHQGLSTSGWIIYTGLEDTKIKIDGMFQANTATGGAGDNVTIQPRKTSISNIETDLFPSASTNIASGRPSGSSYDITLDIKNGEGIRLFVVNNSGTTGITISRINYNFYRF